MEASSAASVRMEPLATLPVFFKLNGRRVLMAGGDAGAAWKTELLAAAGARVEVFAAHPCEALEALALSPVGGEILLVRRRWAASDFHGAALAIGACEDDDVAIAFRQAARDGGVPVNVIDNPEYCDFQFGTIVARSPLVIGISTDGAAPVFGQVLRARIEALLPPGLRVWAQAAKDWRPVVQRRQFDFRRRRRFWEIFTSLALEASGRSPTEDDQRACFEGAIALGERTTGHVSLVGCGPGTPDSMTFQAARVLQAADVVVHDADVPSTLVGLSRRESIKISAPGNATDAANLIRARTNAGGHIVWLGTGNPMSCRHWRQRYDLLDDAADRPDRIAGLGNCFRCGGTCLS